MNIKRLLIICALMLFTTGCGPASEQEVEQILSGAAETTVANITVVPDTAVPTLDVNVIVKQTFAALTQQAASQKLGSTPQAPTATPAQPALAATQTQLAPAPTRTEPVPTATLPPAVSTGGVSGQLMYPASGIPSLRVVAFQAGASNVYHVDTALGQKTYELDGLLPGTYRVVAYTLAGGGFTPGLAGGYSKAVPCGLQYGCNDHTLIDVVVTSGHVTTDVDPNDYYAPQGTFPPDPIP